MILPLMVGTCHGSQPTNTPEVVARFRNEEYVSVMEKETRVTVGNSMVLGLPWKAKT